MALSYNNTGKYTSQNHQNALEAGKFTIGEAAKIFSKTFKKNIKSADIKVYATEWHHSGFFRGGNGKSVMGRTWFFSNENFEAAEKFVSENLSIFPEIEKKSGTAKKNIKIIANIFVLKSAKSGKIYSNKYSDFSGSPVRVFDCGNIYKIIDCNFSNYSKKKLEILKENISFLQINNEIIIGDSSEECYISNEKIRNSIKERFIQSRNRKIETLKNSDAKIINRKTLASRLKDLTKYKMSRCESILYKHGAAIKNICKNVGLNNISQIQEILD